MSFHKQQSLATFVHGIGVYDHASPATVVFNDRLYVFYVGSGNDGIYYTSAKDWNWASIRNINDQARNIGVALNTSPSAVIFQDKIYLFYNGAGDDGTWYTTFDGSTWSPASSIAGKVGGMGFQQSTSPTAAVHQRVLYLFWSGSGDDGVWQTRFDGNNWAHASHVPEPGLGKGTSPCAITFNQKLYLFWNGGANDGTFYSSFEDDKWVRPRSVSAQNGGQGCYPGTSPTALVLDDKSLRLFWVGSGGPLQGLWYSDFVLNPYTWKGQKNMASEIGGQGLKDYSSACAVQHETRSYVFWEGRSQDIWFTYEVSG